MRSSSHNALIKRPSPFENRLADLSESHESIVESSLNLQPMSQGFDRSLSKEEQMRRRDQKATEKSAELVSSELVMHRPRKGERYWSEAWC